MVNIRLYCVALERALVVKESSGRSEAMNICDGDHAEGVASLVDPGQV